MKKIFVLLAFFKGCLLFAQTPFEGKVVYHLQSPPEKMVAVITAYFGKQRIRMEFSENGRPADKEVIVIALDSGTIIRLNYEAKTYGVKVLIKREQAALLPKQIAGYTASPRQAETVLSGWLGGYLSQSVFYVADSLWFPVPAVYKGNTELVTVYDDRVVLGAEISLRSTTYEQGLAAADSAETGRDRISAEAVEIKPYAVEAGLFSIPADFTAEQQTDYRNDTTALYLDSLDSRAFTPPALPKKKKTKPVNKTSGTSKSPANRRKNR